MRVINLRTMSAIIAVSLMMVTATDAAAQSGTVYAEGNALHAGQLDVPLNKSQVLNTDRPFKRIMVGNEEIADILPVTNQSVYILGKQVGTTNLTLYDSNNRVLSVVDIAVGPDVISLRRQLSELMPAEQIGVNLSNDSVVLTGIATSGPAIDQAVQLARTYVGEEGNVVNMMSLGASQQVMLEVRFSEINRQSAKNIGVGAFLGSRGGTFNGVTGDGSQLVPDENGFGVLQRSAVTDAFGVVTKVFNIGSLNINGILDALESKGMSKTLAEPTLVALSGETASFLAGGEFPIPVVQNGGGGSGDGGGNVSIEFKPFGVSLAFTPTVLADGVINLAVIPEVSSIDEAASIRINGLSIPGLQTRRANTVLELRDGESFAIAGLLQQDFSNTVRQVPILGSIPIIGSLFRSTGFRKGETELIIVVTPRLVQPVSGEQIVLPTDRVGTPTEGEMFFFGRTDKAVTIDPINPNALPPEQRQMKSEQEGGTTGPTGYEY